MPKNLAPTAVRYNVLSDAWMEVFDLNGNALRLSPLNALARANKLRCIASATPLDLFAAFRFLLTLLYWKEDAPGGIDGVRQSLIKGRIHRATLEAIKKEEGRFELFDSASPFLQDRAIRKTTQKKSAGSLFAEIASGTNIAHFHHTDDKHLLLCLPCTVIGMLRVIPWSQSGGSGLTPSIHSAPPITVIALGETLASTLGLNLIPLSVAKGKPTWTGKFEPKDPTKPIPYMEAFTWNPRRIFLHSGEEAATCSRCGKSATPCINSIVYLKNDATQKPNTTKRFLWRDPSIFYSVSEKGESKPVRSFSEKMAAASQDLRGVYSEKTNPAAMIVDANSEHRDWLLVVPCTNPANNKSFDHRLVKLHGLLPEAIRSAIISDKTMKDWGGPVPQEGRDGWANPRQSNIRAAQSFIRLASRILSHRDWFELSRAEYKRMNDSHSGFEVFSGVFWAYRRSNFSSLSREACWLILKLMASVPGNVRAVRSGASYSPMQSIPKRQLAGHGIRQGKKSRYPASLPRGIRLETELRRALEAHLRTRNSKPIDWAGLCEDLDQLLDQ